MPQAKFAVGNDSVSPNLLSIVLQGVGSIDGWEEGEGGVCSKKVQKVLKKDATGTILKSVGS